MKNLLNLILALGWVAAGTDSRAQNIFVNLRTSGATPSTSVITAPAGVAYSAAAPVAGTTWNNVSRTATVPSGTTAGSTAIIYNSLPLTSATGSALAQTLTVSYYSTVTTGSRTEPSTAGGENTIQPGGVMAEAWRNYLNASGNYFIFTISNLSAATPYGIYFYGGAGSGQGAGLTVPAGYTLANSPASAFTTNTTANGSGAFGALWTVASGATSLMPQGTSWNTLYGKSDAAGVFKFWFNGPGGYAYFNGFQIVPLSAPGLSGLTNQIVIAGNNAALSAQVTGLPAASLQWYSNNVPVTGATSSVLPLNNVQFTQNNTAYSLVASNILGTVTNSMGLTVLVTPGVTGLNNQAVSVGATVTIPATVLGVPAPVTHWQFNGLDLSDGATGNGSTLAGSATATLSLASAQAADTGVYSLIASNSAGAVTNRMTLTVSAGDVAPGITGLTDQTVVQTSNATFSVSVSGLPLPALQWLQNGSVIAGATSSSLTLSNVQFSQNGTVYSLVASNSAGGLTNSATLYVLVPPLISASPTNLTVPVGFPASFTVTASGFPAVNYQWSRNGNPIASATNASYTVASAQGTDQGAVFSVAVSNSVGMAASSNATLTVLSTTLTGVVLPTNGAVNISPDQQFRIVFSGGPPRLAYTGKKLYVRDAADNSLFATIDTSRFQTFTTDSATVSNACIRTEQGQSFFYMPIAVYGNEAWITLNPTNRLAYGKTYYVTFDAGLFLDATGAAFPGIAASNAWVFSTKASGPTTPSASTGPTNLIVALDGAGDFATLQGASDWIPQNNTLRRTITMQPGVYHDFAIFTQNRNFVTVMGSGATRQDVQIIYPNAAYTSGSSCGLLRVESSDLYFRNLTLDNQVYLTNSLDNYGPWAGRLNTVDTTGNRLIFDNVMIKGGQDTLYPISGSAYFNHCEVWGSTDFIYGGAVAVFDQCNIVEIKSSGGPCTAPSTPYAQPYGLVFVNCNFPQALVANGYPYDVGSASTSFMRPWGQDGNTAVINCAVDSQISAAGWTTFGSGTETTCRAREAGTTLIASGSAVNVPAVRWNAGAYWVNTYDPDYTSSSMSPNDPLLAVPTGTNNRVALVVDTNTFTLSAIFGNSYFGLGSWLPAVLPTITMQPTNQAVNAGATVFFAVTATGVPSPLLQWQKNGANLINQTNATLIITNVQNGDAGIYSLMASNSAGVVVSSNALLSLVTVVPAITTQPTNQIVASGATAVFTVAASGIPAPAFQWYKNGVPLPNATNATLTLASVQVVDVAVYWVAAANGGGTMVSGNATLTLTGLPAINLNHIEVVTNAAYGAVGDGVYTNTAAIQNAINKAAAGGKTNGLSGGTVEIPAGIYLSGPLTLSSYVNLQIDAGATLQMLPYGSFPATSDFISGSSVHDIALSGSGTIDGQGAVWWATNNATSGGITRPKTMFAASTCSNILLHDVTLQNPPNTHISFRYVCVNVTVDHINVNTPDGTPNTDGIDCSGNNVLIANSHITDGDDHIALGDGHPGNFNHDITITNCLFGTGHGVSIGSYTEGGLSNLLVINCVWTNGTSGIHFKADDDRGGLVQNLRFLNLAMTNTQIPIFLYSYYTNNGTSTGVSFAKAASYPAFPVTSTTPIWRNITISNFTAVPASGFAAGIIWGKPEMAISNVILDHVNIRATKYFQLYNVRGVQLIDSQITTTTATNVGLYNAELIITNRTPVATPVLLDGITTNGVGNSLACYRAQASLKNTNALDAGPLTLAASTLTVSNNLTLAPSTVLNYTLGTNAATIVIKGSLQLGGNFNLAAGDGFASGTYPLLTYSGGLSGTLPALGAIPAGYSCRLDTNIIGVVNLIVSSVPPPPVNLTAQGTNLLVNLQWLASTGATGYELLRSSTNGGPYATVANLSATHYADAAVNPGTTYYYVVTATNSAGESALSLPASAVALPSLVVTGVSLNKVGNQLQLSWPLDHTGWRLQIQTNDGSGLGTNWFTVPNSTNVTQLNVLADPGNPGVFLRLIYP